MNNSCQCNKTIIRILPNTRSVMFVCCWSDLVTYLIFHESSLLIVLWLVCHFDTLSFSHLIRSSLLHYVISVSVYIRYRVVKCVPSWHLRFIQIKFRILTTGYNLFNLVFDLVDKYLRQLLSKYIVHCENVFFINLSPSLSLICFHRLLHKKLSDIFRCKWRYLWV